MYKMKIYKNMSFSLLYYFYIRKIIQIYDNMMVNDYKT